MATMIGAARVVFGADTVQFDSSAKGIEGTLGRLQEKFAQFEARLRRLGAGMTLAVTVPFAAMVKKIDNGARDFEAQMKRVDAALGGVSGKQLDELGMLARKLGPAVGKGATEAAEGIDALARAGLSAADIAGGGLKATLKLAASGYADVAPAAALVTDVMGQFHKTAEQLPAVTRDVVGALDASKLEFVDFQQAIAQGGGIAASAGVSFSDFATAIAATSKQFSSGADAGTSYKTYIQSLNPVSKEAERAMETLGLKFFDASGKMKPLAEQAEMLRAKLGDLTDQSKSEALKTIFGADAARTAIGLMDQGRKGIEALQAQIAKGDVDGKIAKSLEGSAAASQRIANAWESLKISLGDTGLLAMVTQLKNALAGMIESMAAAPPMILKIAAVFAGLASAIGPLLLVLGNLGALILPMVAARFGLIGWAIAAVINPIGTLGVVVARLIMNFAGGMILARIGTLLAGLVSPLGLVALGVTALSLAWQAHAARVAASEAEQQRLETTLNGAKPSLDKVGEAVADLAGKTGDAAVKAREHANAMLGEAKAAGVAAARIEALTRVQRAHDAVNAAREFERGARAVRGISPAANFARDNGIAAMREEAELRIKEAASAVKSMKNAYAEVRRYDQAINGPSAQLRSIDFSGGEGSAKKKGGGSGSTAANYDADNREQLKLQAELEAARMRNDQLTVRALEDRLDRSRQIEAYQRTGLSLAEATKAAERDMAMLGAARAEQDARELVDDQRRFELRLAEIEGNGLVRESLEKQQYLQERINHWLNERKTLTEATALATAEQVRLDGAVAAARERAAKAAEAQRQIDLARARGDSEERIRALETEADIEKRIAELRRGTDASGPMDEASARAQAETEAMEGEMARRQGIFRDTIKGGFRAALDGNFGSWFEGWWKDRVAKGLEDALNSLADVISQAFSGGGASGGGGLGGLLGGIASAIGGLFGGGGGSWLDVGSLPGFKTGGSFTVGGPSGIDRAMVAFRATAGEMVHITRPGQEIGGPVGGVTFDLRGAVMTEDLLRQMEVIANGAAGEAVGANNRLIGRRARARLA